jgi:hypothetical protein
VRRRCLLTSVFDAVLVCRAVKNSAIARFLDVLDGWHTEAVIATRDVPFEAVGAER